MVIVAFVLRLIRWHLANVNNGTSTIACRRNTYQIKVLSKVVNQPLANHVIVLIVARVMPVVQKSAEHGACLPPVIRRIQYARIASEDIDALFVTGRILRNELFRDQ